VAESIKGLKLMSATPQLKSNSAQAHLKAASAKNATALHALQNRLKAC